MVSRISRDKRSRERYLGQIEQGSCVVDGLKSRDCQPTGRDGLSGPMKWMKSREKV
jgi:hypothetical protein